MTEEQAPTLDRDAALRKAYQTATASLRDNHRDEFNDLYTKAAAELGVEWKPKPSAAERAREQLQSILRDHPELADEVQVGTSQ